jgi:hypothetical protein
MKFSINNRLILETYVKKALEARREGGIATPGQRDGLKGLKVLVDAYLSDGRHIPKGSVAYIREEELHSHAWASKPYTCDTIESKFILVDHIHVSFFDIVEFGK